MTIELSIYIVKWIHNCQCCCYRCCWIIFCILLLPLNFQQLTAAATAATAEFWHIYKAAAAEFLTMYCSCCCCCCCCCRCEGILISIRRLLNNFLPIYCCCCCCCWILYTIGYIHSQMQIQLSIYIVKWLYNWLYTSSSVYTINYVHSHMTIKLPIYIVKWIYNWLYT